MFNKVVAIEAGGGGVGPPGYYFVLHYIPGWQYKSTNTDAAAGTKAQILMQPALPDMQWCHLAEMGQYGVFPKTTKNGNTHPSADRPQWKLLPEGQVGQYKSTNPDAAAGTKARILTQPALPGSRA